MKHTDNIKRYPGVYSFTKEQQSLFYGRARDIENLKTLIEVEKQVLLYSKSGVGKTSLLNAGVLPKLPPNYEVLNIRFYAFNNEMSPIARVESIIKEKYPVAFENTNSIIDALTDDAKAINSIWLLLKKIQYTYPDKVFVLVFDQFEELFSYPDSQVEGFKQQLFEINSSRIPKVFSDRIKKEYKAKNPIFLNKEDFKFLHQFPEVKNVFAIRSDRLSLLNRLTDKLPKIQHTFYELKPLTIQQAEQAIVNPAQTANKNFETASYEFDDKAIKHIIDTLSNGKVHTIETTQLQIVCQRIEEIAHRKQSNKLDDSIITITYKDLPGFEDIFFSFYENAVSKTLEKEEVHIFIEDQLIRNGQRISLDEIICKEAISEESLRTLTNSHLLRAEPNSTGGFSYELSHDTLVEPILTSRKERKEKEKILKEKEKAKREQQKLVEARKRQRKIIYIVSVAAIISVAFAAFGLAKMKEANNALNALKDTQYHINFEKGKEAQKVAKYDKAIEKYKVAQEFVDTKTQRAIEKERAIEVEKAIKFCISQKEKEKEFRSLKQAADSLYIKREWVKSLQKYIAANKLGYDDISNTVASKKIEILEQLSKEEVEYIEINSTVALKGTREKIRKIKNLN